MTNKKNMTIEGKTITVTSDDILAGKVTSDDVLVEILELIPNVNVEILDLSNNPIKVEVKGNLNPYTLETMPDHFTKSDVLEYNENIELARHFAAKVNGDFYYEMIVSDELIRKVISKNNPILNEKDVETIMMYARDNARSHSEQISMIDTLTDVATEVLKNHQK